MKDSLLSKMTPRLRQTRNGSSCRWRVGVGGLVVDG